MVFCIVATAVGQELAVRTFKLLICDDIAQCLCARLVLALPRGIVDGRDKVSGNLSARILLVNLLGGQV